MEIFLKQFVYKLFFFISILKKLKGNNVIDFFSEKLKNNVKSLKFIP